MRFLLLIITALWVSTLCAQSQDMVTETTNQNITGREIMEKFNKAKEVNYPYSPLVHSAILTEKETLKGDRLYTSKALVEYMRAGYFDEENDKIRLINGHNDVHIDSLFKSNMLGGLSQIKKDIIKYPIEILDSKNSEYEFRAGQIVVDNEIQYKVELVPKNDKAKYEGFLYFDYESYALVKAEVSLTDFGIKLLNRIQSKNDFEWVDLKETIIYTKPDWVKHYLADDDRYYLSSIVTKGHGIHLKLKEKSVVTNSLRIISTNRTTFFANEYEDLDDNKALSKLDFDTEEP